MSDVAKTRNPINDSDPSIGKTDVAASKQAHSSSTGSGKTHKSDAQEMRKPIKDQTSSVDKDAVNKKRKEPAGKAENGTKESDAEKKRKPIKDQHTALEKHN
jgi:hypothetical protein